MGDTSHTPSHDGQSQRLTSFEVLTSRADFDWVSVLKDAGAESYLTGKNGPCPFCGGTDRFQFSLKKVAWFCRVCPEGGGPASDFLKRFMGYTTFQQLADHIRRFYGIQAGSPSDAQPRPAVAPMPKQPVMDKAKSLARMAAIWGATREVQSGDPVDRYLRFRIPGLQHIPPQIRIHPALEYWDAPAEMGGRPVLVGKFPAMVVQGFDASNNLVQIHKTYLTSSGAKAAVKHPKKTDVGVGSNSFAFRLGEPVGYTLGVAEGIETALAATLLDGHPVWPCHSSTILSNFVLPEHLRSTVKMVIIYADSDEMKQGKKAGSVAAAALASKLRQERVRSMIVRPAKVGADMADLIAR